MGSTDSKLAFKKKVFRLADAQVISQNEQYWDMFWKEPQSAGDIFTLLTSHDIKTIKNRNPVNFYLLIRIVATRLIYLSNHPKFPDIALAPELEVLNCCRLLTRVLPFLFEDQNTTAQQNEIFWKTLGDFQAYSSQTENATVGSLSAASALSNVDHDRASMDVNIHQDNHGIASPVSERAVVSESKFLLPLGAQLVHTCVSLLMTKHFSIEDSENKNVKGIDYGVWEPGIGTGGKFQPPNPKIDVNRLEVLRLLIALCSQCLYTSPQCLIDKGSRFLTVLVTTLPQVKLLTFICLLVNTTCRGCVTSRAKGGNEDSSLLSENPIFQELRCLLITYTAQLLGLCLSYPIPNDDIEFLQKSSMLGPSTGNNGTFPPNNLVRLYLSKLHKSSELLYLANSFLKYFKAPILQLKEHEDSSLSMIKHKMPTPGDIPLWITEIVVITWELVQCNKSFVKCLLLGKTKDNKEFFSSELMICLLYYVVTYAEVEDFKNTRRMICYFILYLSSNQGVVFNLLAPLKTSFFKQLPSHFTKAANPVTYRDLFIYQSCHMLLFNFKLSTDLLTPTHLEWLYNLIPVAVQSNEITKPTNESLVRNSKLITPGGGLSYSCCGIITQLVIKLSSPQILMENAMNPDLLSLLIRSITNALLYYPVNSRNLVYVIAKNSRIYNNVFETIIGLMNENEQDEALLHELNTSRPGSANSKSSSFVIEENETPEENKHDIEEYDTDEQEVHKALRPKPPMGMSEKAKGKLPVNAPLSKTWSGLVAINVILKIIEMVRKEIPDFESYNSTKVMDILDRITSIQNYVEKIRRTDTIHYNYAMKPQPLKFTWSKLSLGWYESILWGKIFNIELVIHLKFQENFYIGYNLVSTMNKFGFGSFFSKDSKSDNQRSNGFFSRMSRNDKLEALENINEAEQVKQAITSISYFAHTNIKLFEVKSIKKEGPTLEKPKGAVEAVASSLMQQYLMLTGRESQVDGNEDAHIQEANSRRTSVQLG